VPTSLVERIGEISGEVVAMGDINTMAACKWRLSRLQWRLEESGRGDPVLCGALRSSVSTLGVGARMMRVATDEPKRRQTLDSRILNVLSEGAKRPMTLSDVLDVHQSQISRSLRSLRGKGRVVRAARPAWEEDWRGQWYALAIPPSIAAETGSRCSPIEGSRGRTTGE
jgi:hypothetical protein